MKTADERFWASVDRNGPVPPGRPDLGPCWLWTGNTPNGRYGRFMVDGRSVSAHHYSYETTIEPIPDGLVTDHLCRVKNCVRPSHLEAVTQRENLMRGDTIAAANAAKTHCKRGHPFDVANTRWRAQKGTITRNCRACNGQPRLA